MSGRFESALNKALEAPYGIPASTIAGMLVYDDPGFETDLFAAAREVKTRCGKTSVLPRGLIEVSNVCSRDCLYCGIRRSNAKTARYSLSEDQVAACIDEARRRGYPAVAFQAGEVASEANTCFYERIIRRCRGLEVTLSLGEQTEDVYRRWKDAAGDGVLRYLIRIETSNRELFSAIHPAGQSFDGRLACIRTLKRLGYVTGSGVMIGLPGQTAADLAADIVFFGRERLDMVGMGPFVPHADTPLGRTSDVVSAEARLSLALRMIALTRLYLHGVNIVAASALEALDPVAGRSRGIDAGANVIMPVLTPSNRRAAYDLYPGKARCAEEISNPVFNARSP